jgi:uncharacterized repeat protein (TIGR03809 family)
MTYRTDVAWGRDIMARWCALAEQRLEHLTELFETGRWRRYHSELSFLENIQEAKSAVEIWRDLSNGEAALHNSARDISSLARSRTSLPRSQVSAGQAHRLQPGPVEIPAEPARADVSIVPRFGQIGSNEVRSAPGTNVQVSEKRLNTASEAKDTTAIAERYPLLRNAL